MFLICKMIWLKTPWLKLFNWLNINADKTINSLHNKVCYFSLPEVCSVTTRRQKSVKIHRLLVWASYVPPYSMTLIKIITRSLHLSIAKSDFPPAIICCHLKIHAQQQPFLQALHMHVISTFPHSMHLMSIMSNQLAILKLLKGVFFLSSK